MKLEWLQGMEEYGLESDEIVRLFDFTKEEALLLKKAIEYFVIELNNPLDLTRLTYVEALNCNLIFQQTDTDYGKGFKAGCESAWDQSTKGLKDIVKPSMNPVLLATNPDYSSGWFDGSEQCTYIVDWDVT